MPSDKRFLKIPSPLHSQNQIYKKKFVSTADIQSKAKKTLVNGSTSAFPFKSYVSCQQAVTWKNISSHLYDLRVQTVLMIRATGEMVMIYITLCRRSLSVTYYSTTLFGSYILSFDRSKLWRKKVIEMIFPNKRENFRVYEGETAIILW